MPVSPPVSLASRLAPLCLAALLAGCGTVGNVVGAVTGGDSPPVATEPAGAVSANPSLAAGGAVRCPEVQIRSGTQGLTRYAAGRQGEASGVRHQFSITRTARDCRLVDGVLSLRVGVAGRVVLGPAGAPGTLAAPMRFAVARGGVEPVYANARTVTATVPAGATSAEFDIVDTGIAITIEPDETVRNFQIFVGFDA